MISTRPLRESIFNASRKLYLVCLVTAVLGLFILRSYRARRLLSVVRRKHSAEAAQMASRSLARLLNIQTEFIPPILMKRGDTVGRLFVANHLSYIDAIILLTVHPFIFVTSQEVAEDPFLGLFARFAGSLFVERRHSGTIEEDIDQISLCLREGFDVLIFLEGTSSKGDTVLPFRSSLLEAARRARTVVCPLVLTYPEIDGKKTNAVLRDVVCYYGDMTFFPHLSRFVELHSLRCFVRVLTPVPAHAEPTRRRLAERLHADVKGRFRPLVEPVPV